MERCVKSEVLDTLPESDPRAWHSRRDLRRINACMGNVRLVAACLTQFLQSHKPRRIIDLGAGDGSFLQGLTRDLPALVPGTELVFVERLDVVEKARVTDLRARGFRVAVVQTDAWPWLRRLPPQPGTWILANLFLHHFTAEVLRTGFAVWAEQAELCCACEPRRGAWPWLVSRLTWFIGANSVTRHDAPLSVRAGFNGAELSALWPEGSDWALREHAAGLFSHLFFCQRAVTSQSSG